MTSTPSTLPSQEPSNSAPAVKEQSHLGYLDGVRALMALWVACGHSFQDFIHVVNSYQHTSSFLPQPLFQQAFFAHFAVDVFIVLSGFCLMLPVARTNRFQIPGGWQNFLYRRARRIVPPYYAALLLAAAMSGLRWWITRPIWESRIIQTIDFRPSSLWAHLFLIQNMWDPWARSLDGPTWSVATESQIYILFPLILLPLWRKIHPLFVIALGYTFGIIVLFETWNGTRSGLTSCAWYIGLFAMGMWSSTWYVRSRNTKHRPYLLAASLLLIAVTTYCIDTIQWSAMLMWKLDLLVGGAAAGMLAYFGSFSKTDRRGPALRLLEWRPLVALGTFSYSFYLIHVPLLNVAVTLLLKNHANGFAGALCLLATLTTIVFIARLFYQYIELPSMAKKPRTATSAVLPV